ncbi:MAG: peptide MFS transporter [Thermoanaerobaculia bacterium]
MSSTPTVLPAVEDDRKQPPGIFLIFLVEMWERFSYYGMRAILILFLVDTTTGGFGWSRESASQLYGWYTGLVYLTPIVGGWIADRFIGTHRSLIIGGIIIAIGQLCLIPLTKPMFFLGLLLIIVGTGFFKSNCAAMVGQLYHENDPRRDAGFTLYYMSVNVGAFIAPLIVGYLGESPRFGWHWGFGAGAIGMVLGLIAYVTLKRRVMGNLGDRPSQHSARKSASGHTDPLTKEEKERMIAIFIVAFFVIFFFVAFEQAGSSMNLFARDRTDRATPGWMQSFYSDPVLPASWFQSINALGIILLAPIFAKLWTVLGRKKKDPSTPTKMAIGLLLLGAGFVFMVIGARLSDGGMKVSPLWLVAAYTLHTCGELSLSPVGMSLVSRLSPPQFLSMMMGVWFLSSFFANLASGYVAGAVTAVEQGRVFTLFGVQADFFLMFVVSSAVAGLALLALVPKMKSLMHGRG